MLNLHNSAGGQYLLGFIDEMCGGFFKGQKHLADVTVDILSSLDHVCTGFIQ